MSSEPRPGLASENAVLRVGEFVFEPATGELRGPGGASRLRRQAARALELLARNPGRLVTREALRAHIWGETNVDFGQGLNTCIKEVRIGLGDSAEAPLYIETFPRRGYRMIARVGREGPEAVAPSAPAPFPATGAAASRRPWIGRRTPAALLAGLLALTTVLVVGPSSPARSTGSAGASADAELERLLARGRHLLRTRDPEALSRSLALLEDASARAPRDGRVWAALGDLHRVLAGRRPEKRRHHTAEAARAASRALELAPGLSAAHASHAAVLEDAGRLGEAEAAFERAIALDPADPTARHWFADLLRRQGRLEEAFVHARAAREADPLSAGACTSLAYVHLLRGELSPARAAFEEALVVEPDFAAAQLGLSRVHVTAREWSAALAVLERSQLPAVIVRGERAYALARSGRRDEARRLVREMQESGDGAQSIAAVYAALGETEEALTRLEAAVTADPGALRSLPADPRFAELRGRQRFEELLRHLGRALGRSLADPART